MVSKNYGSDLTYVRCGTVALTNGAPKTMTTNNIISDDGQLQVESLKAALENEIQAASQPCIVLVVDENVTFARLFLQGIKGERNTNRCIMPLLGAALAELAKHAMDEEPETLAVMGKYFGLGREKKASLSELLAAFAEVENKEGEQDEH